MRGILARLLDTLVIRARRPDILVTLARLPDILAVPARLPDICLQACRKNLLLMNMSFVSMIRAQ